MTSSTVKDCSRRFAHGWHVLCGWWGLEKSHVAGDLWLESRWRAPPPPRVWLARSCLVVEVCWLGPFVWGRMVGSRGWGRVTGSVRWLAQVFVFGSFLSWTGCGFLMARPVSLQRACQARALALPAVALLPRSEAAGADAVDVPTCSKWFLPHYYTTTLLPNPTHVPISGGPSSAGRPRLDA